MFPSGSYFNSRTPERRTIRARSAAKHMADSYETPAPEKHTTESQALASELNKNRSSAPSPMTVLSGQVQNVTVSDDNTTPLKRLPFVKEEEINDQRPDPAIKIAMRQLQFTQPRAQPNIRARLTPSPSSEIFLRRASTPTASPVKFAYSSSDIDGNSSQELSSHFLLTRQRVSPQLDLEAENDNEIMRLIFESNDGNSHNLPIHEENSLDSELLERSHSSLSFTFSNTQTRPPSSLERFTSASSPISIPSRSLSRTSLFPPEDELEDEASPSTDTKTFSPFILTSVSRRLASSPLKGGPEVKRLRSTPGSISIIPSPLIHLKSHTLIKCKDINADNHEDDLKATTSTQAEIETASSPNRGPLQRCKSVPSVSIFNALQSPPPPLLPTIRGDRGEIQWITHETLMRVLSGEFSNVLCDWVVVDCRYPYEYEGGHIKGAVNLFTPDAIEQHFFYTMQPQNDRRLAVVFHCEFSSKRAPALHKHLRALDRAVNRYPALYYPDIYVLSKGYKEFYTFNKEYCEPSAYVQMDDLPTECRRYNNELSRAWKRRNISASARALIKDEASCVCDPKSLMVEEEIAAAYASRPASSLGMSAPPTPIPFVLQSPAPLSPHSNLDSPATVFSFPDVESTS